jgi:hypothetical protein
MNDVNNIIGKNFLDKSKEEQQEIINDIVPAICSEYCIRDNCKGCFIQQLTDIAMDDEI